MKKLLSGFLAVAMLLSMVSAGAVSVPSARTDLEDTQSTSPKETVYVNSYGGEERTIDFDSHWKFYLGDAGSAQTPAFNDSTWRDVNLPHDYSIEQEYSSSGEAESGYLPGGIGWYRKSFTVSPEWSGKNITLNFDGVYMDSTVWLNGEKLGTHPNGYTPFSFQLPADKLNFEGVNVIAVKVNHQTPSSRWYSGSGIYRNVTLTVTEPLHVALNGTTVTTPNLEAEYTAEGKVVNVRVDTMVSNNGNAPQSVTIRQTIYHKSGSEPVGTVTTENAVEIAAGATSTIPATVPVTNPDLWAVGSPNLYTVRTEVLVGAAVKDTYDTDFGFRWFVFDTNTGFALNGTKIKLQGVCMHHDQGALGGEAWRRAIERQVEILQEMGCNSIRVTHNPAAQVLIDVCNEKGMLVIDEIFDGWHEAKNGNSKDYARFFDAKIEAGNTILGGIPGTMKWSEYDLKATIARGKNSPAVIAWSLGNEIQEGASGDMSNGYPARATDLIRWTREADLTRPATIGDNQRGGSAGGINIHNQLANAGTVASGAIGGTIGGLSGYNYAGDGAYDGGHSNHPTWAIYGSETASHVNSRGVYDRKGSQADKNSDRRLTSYDKSAVGWGATASSAWYNAIINDFVAGEYVWTGFDYIGEPTPWNGTGSGASGGKWPAPKSSYFGIIETTGFPKDNFWFYQSQWNSNVNTLHMLPSWNENEIMLDGDRNVEVVVYTDAAKVELYFTPAAGGARTKVGEQSFYTRQSDTGLYTYQSTAQTGGGDTNLYMTFSVPYAPGTLEAVGYDKDGNVIDQTEGRSSVITTGPAAKLAASADRTTIQADGKDLCYVTIDVNDVKDNFINGANPTIKLSIQGDGVIVGTDTGFQNDHSSYQATTKAAFNGKLLAIVQSTEKAGSFTLTASADGLQSSSVTVTTTPVGGESGRNLTSYDVAKNYYVKLGNMPVLPSGVTAHYSDGTSENKNVRWDAIDESKIHTVGTFAVSGALEGTPFTVTVNINMLDEVTALLNYAAAIQVGGALVLPENRPAVMADGTILTAEFPVTWDRSSFDAGEAGTYVIPGAARVFGKALEVTATVRVAAPSVSTGINVISAAADFTQSVPLEYQSDNLEAIRDGVKTSAGYWSNYDAAQQGQHESTLTLRYDTAQNVGNLKLYFYTDNRAFALPDGVKLEWSMNGAEWTPIQAKASADSATGGVTTRAYTFTPVPAVFFRMTFTDKAGRNPTSLKQYATAVAEAELYTSVSSFSVSSSAALTGLTVNGTAATAAELANHTVSTPAYFVNSLEVGNGNNAAYTVLPTKDNIVRILTESEDHTNRSVYQILTAQGPAAGDPADGSRDYPIAKLTATAGSEQSPQDTDGPASWAIDNDPTTLWHTSWSPDDNLTNQPNKRWFMLELEEPTTLDALRYLRRQGGSTQAFISGYDIQTSMDGTNWTSVKTGTFTEGTAWQIAAFENAVTAKYVKLIGTTPRQYMTAGEIRVREAEEKIDLSGASVTFDATSFDYTGSAIEPRPTVLLDGRKLVYGMDFTVGYSANTAPGIVTCTVTGILDYSGSTTGQFTINEGTLTVLSYTETAAKTFAGQAPTTLPAKVSGQTSAGTTLQFDVVWDEIDPAEYASRGSFVVEGTVAGQSAKPIATVTVVDALAAQSVSTATVKDIAPTLPAEVTVYLSDGATERHEVTWSNGDYSAAATVVVNGTVNLGHGKTIATTASVRVVEGTATDNIALNAAKSLFPLALGYISAGDNNPYSAIDGNSTYTARWCDWESGTYHTNPKSWVAVAPKGTSVPGDRNSSAEVTLEKQVINQAKIVFADEGTTDGTGAVTYPADYEVQYFSGNVDTMTIDTTLSPASNAKQGNGMVTALGTSHALNTDSNWTTVTYTGSGKPAVVEARDTVLTVDFEAVNTSLIRVLVTPRTNKWTGVAELEVYGIEATANDSFALTNIKLDGAEANFNGGYEITVDSLPATITAEATNNAAVTVVPAVKAGTDAKVIITSEDGSTEETYTIHIATASSFGVTVTPADHGAVTAAATALEGDTVILTVTPDRGYQLKAGTLKVNGDEVAVAHNRFTMPGEAVTVTAEFEPITYRLTYVLDGGVTEGANPATYTVETPAFTLKNPARQGMSFLGWTGGGQTENTAAVTIAKGSIGDRAYTAHYGQLYTITVAEAEHGTVTVPPTAQAGDTVVLTPAPDDGYMLDTIAVKYADADTAVAVDNRNTFGMPAANVVVTTTFKEAEYAITYTLGSGALGDGVTNPATYKVSSESITLNNPTWDGHVFAGWVGTGLTGPTMTVTIPKGSSGNRSYIALYHDYHAVSVAGLKYGTLTAAPASAIVGTTITITATAEEGYHIKDGSLQVYKTGDLNERVTLNGMTFVMPDYAVTVSAAFESDSTGGTPGGNPGGGSGGGSVAPPPVTNPDGSNTTTVTKPDGTATITTKYPDGSKTVVQTKKDGSATVTADKPAAVVIPVKDAKPSMVAVIVKADGTEEMILMSTLTDKGMGVLVPGDATIKFIDNEKTFTDVTEKHWAGDAIAFATSRELFKGVGGGNFNPAGTMNRSMLVTVLWRMNGTPKAAANADFSDVGSAAWYADAVNWAADAGIVTGSGTTFAPDGTLTRETLVTMLYRSAQNMGLDTEKSSSLASYGDAAAVSKWATPAMSWAIGMGIVRSNDAGKLDPSGVATRAEAATILQRFTASMF